MENFGNKGILGFGAMGLIVMVMMVNGVESRLVKVGDKGWVPDYNFTDWSSRVHIYVGDWIIFNFDKRYYNVLEVNQTSFESCNDKGFIKNITRGGRDVVQLTEPRTYYFLSSGGYCWHGMKVAINVEQIPPKQEPAPAPVPANGDSPSRHPRRHIVVMSMALSYLALAVVHGISVV